ncbi:hypothetical protein L210DRAFT_170502 [Boletus edulis BED1]|uniref:Uncharacterized protein n=1 Tax=Boletus edulis BED1 TaxID=1328754 RepID=A0AAD4G8Z1_BOLED|nr:hypothetical protein L210DRAFT_170502 [Boletus edulis BED1]
MMNAGIATAMRMQATRCTHGVTRKLLHLELYAPDCARLIKEWWLIERMLTWVAVRLAAARNRILSKLGKGEARRGHLTL